MLIQKWRQLWHNHIQANAPSNAEQAIRLNFLRRVLPVILPVMTLLILMRLFMFEAVTIRTYLIYFGALATVASIYFATKTKRYYLVMILMYILGSTIIVVNAATTSPPHTEIFYLVLLSLFASMFLSFHETLFWAFFTVIVIVIFGLQFILPNNADIFTDFLQQSFIFNIFILFAAFQRNRLEKDRRDLAIT